MIYNDIVQAKSDLHWLIHDCSLSQFAASRLNGYEYGILEDDMSAFDDTSLLDFYTKLFTTYHLKTPQWSKKLTPLSLPVIVFTPSDGLGIIFEREADGGWKIESRKGIRIEHRFPEGSFFAAIKTDRNERDKQSAPEMFKAIALRQKPMIIHAAIASFSINLLALGTSFFSMQVYDRVIPTQGLSTLVALSIGVFIAIVLEMILKIARSRILDHASRNMDISYSHDIFSRFLQVRTDALPKSIGTLSGQLQSYGNVRAFISTAALYVLIDFPFSVIFLSVIILLAGWIIGLIAFVFLLISIMTGMFFRKKIEMLSKTASTASHKKLGLLVETVENAENVKATGAGWSILNRWNALTEDAVHDDIEIRHYSELTNYIAAFLQQLSYVVLVAAGAYLVATSATLTMGGLIATTILSGRVLSPIAMLPNLLVQWGRTKIAIKDIDQIYTLKMDNEGIARPLSPVLSDPRIECRNVLFQYTPDIAAIRLPQLMIKPGERVAILGSIGSGKSTLLKLLNGLYMPQEGKILINGIDMQHISRNRLNETIGLLPQNIKLLSGTLRDNLLLGLAGISDEQIINAAQKTGLIGLINSLPQGLDTAIPEGGESVSGGQKQFIALTRMVLASPKIWLLDEPTASMDEASERHILGVLNQELSSDKTLIVVTHKPAILGLVNRVIVMTPQGIAMDGPRDAVLQQLQLKSQVKA
jgi:ATP-binding cassette, subfamily C, bacterial LapB